MKALAPLWLALAAACASDPTPRRPAAVPPPARAPIEEQAARAEAASAPGPRHRALDPLAGVWDTRSVDVDAAGVESDERRGRAELAWVLAGRFLEWKQTLELHTGVRASQGYLGYHTYLGDYELVMVSDLSSGMGVAHGTGDLSRAGIRFALEVPDPASGGVRRAVSVLRLDGPNGFALDQLLEGADGVERVVRRMHFTRAQGSARSSARVTR